MISGLKTAILMGIAVSLFFYFNPKIPTSLGAFFIGLWMLFYFMDARITLANAKLIPIYEVNFIFPIFYKRIGLFAALPQLAIEIIIVLIISLFFEFFLLGSIQNNITNISFLGMIFGLAHFEAYFSNRKFLRNLNSPH